MFIAAMSGEYFAIGQAVVVEAAPEGPQPLHLHKSRGSRHRPFRGRTDRWGHLRTADRLDSPRRESRHRQWDPAHLHTDRCLIEMHPDRPRRHRQKRSTLCLALRSSIVQPIEGPGHSQRRRCRRHCNPLRRCLGQYIRRVERRAPCQN